jgi:hypothetical protein
VMTGIVSGCRQCPASAEGEIMSEGVTDRSLLDVSDLVMSEPLDESALAKALRRILSSEGPCNSFSANI